MIGTEMHWLDWCRMTGEGAGEVAYYMKKDVIANKTESQIRISFMEAMIKYLTHRIQEQN